MKVKLQDSVWVCHKEGCVKRPNHLCLHMLRTHIGLLSTVPSVPVLVASSLLKCTKLHLPNKKVRSIIYSKHLTAMSKGSSYRFGHKAQNGTEALRAKKDANANSAAVHETQQRSMGKPGSKQAKTGATRKVSAPTLNQVPKAADQRLNRFYCINL